MYHAKKIGLFISHIFGRYQTGVVTGALEKAKEYGYRVEIYASMEGENLGDYEKGESSILSIPNFSSLDGIIFVSGTYLSEALREQIRQKLSMESGIPVVELTLTGSSFPQIEFDNNSPFRDLVTHLCKEHNASRICYLGYRPQPFFSDARDAYYREAMEENHLTVGDHDIYLVGDEVKEYKEALSFFLEGGSFDSVVCYNDQVALTFLQTAKDMGYHIPDDFSITGCDNLQESLYSKPPLTTITFPVEELGAKAVEHILLQKKGLPTTDASKVKAAPIFRGTCGCPSEMPKENWMYWNQQSHIATLERSIFDSIYMATQMHNCADIDEGAEALAGFLHKLPHVEEAYLCLYPDWDMGESKVLAMAEKDQGIHRDQSILKLGFAGDKTWPECSFQKGTLLPEMIEQSSTHSYVVCPLYYGDESYGYLVLGYQDDIPDYQVPFTQFLLNINQMLHNCKLSRHASLMEDRLEEFYFRDTLTGLYNRDGYQHNAESFLDHAIETGASLTCYLLDMNKLKVVNDTYGHEAGDTAIQTIAEALKRVSSEQDISCRLGGDEFFHIAYGLGEEESTERMEQIHQYLANYSKLSGKPYDITVSIGMVRFIPQEGDDIYTLAGYMKQADEAMYTQKNREEV